MHAQFITDAKGQRTAVILAIEDYARLIDDLAAVEAICSHDAPQTAAVEAVLSQEAPSPLEKPPQDDERDDGQEGNDSPEHLPEA